MADFKITDLTPEMLKEHAPKLFEQIKASVDPDTVIQELTDGLKKAKTDLKDVSDKFENLQKEFNTYKETKEKGLADMKKEKDGLQGKVDKFEAEQAHAAKKEMVAQKLAEAKLPEHLVLQSWKERLVNKSEEEIDQEIAERKQLAEQTKGKVTGMGEEHVPDGDNDKELTEEKKKSIKESLGIKPKQ